MDDSEDVTVVTDTDEDASVVVVGAGLAGLVAARHLATAGIDVTVFERREEVGGRVRTRRRDGFVFDRGFQVLFTAYPAVRRELDLDALDLRYFKPGAVIARPGQRSVLSDPFRDPGALVDSVLNREVTTSDKLRTLALRQDLAGRSEADIFRGRDVSIRKYLREWGFTEKYVENFVAPFYGGITLDRSLTTSKRVFEYTFKMLSEGRTAVPAAGMDAIPKQLAAIAREAGAEIVRGETVDAVDDAGADVTVTTESGTVDADAAVVATDPRSARDLTGVEAVPTDARSCVTQFYRFPGDVDLDTDRRILLNAGDPSPNTVVPMSEVAPEYAPTGETLLNATFLGSDALDRADDDLAAATRGALASWYPKASFESLEPIHTERIEFAQFDQPPNVHGRLPRTRAGGRRVYLAGDYTAWSSIQGAMRSGREAAQAVRADL